MTDTTDTAAPLVMLQRILTGVDAARYGASVTWRTTYGALAQIADTIERLTRELDEAITEHDSRSTDNFDRIMDLNRDLSAAEARIAKLEAALVPFANVAVDDIGAGETDKDWFRPMEFHNRAARLTVGHLRAARAALEARS